MNEQSRTLQHGRRSPGTVAAALAIPMIVGVLSAVLTSNMMKEFHFINKPALAPPGWLFPVVWTLLYLLMGLASWYVFTATTESGAKRKAYVLYGAQLALNFGWTPIFFNLDAYLAAFIWLIALWTVTLVCTIWFFRIRRRAGWLMVPYLLWLTFAGYLNYSIYILSITPMPLPR